MGYKTLRDLNIGTGSKTFIIAEAGINHNGSKDLALKMVDEVKAAGADAIKFQTYVTEKRAPADSPVFKILKKCELSTDDQREIKEYANKQGLMFFSTPFDEESVNFLKSIGVPLIKVASFDIVNKKLLAEVAKTGIPVIFSRGMANKNEIDEAIKILSANNVDFAILHCVSAYPAPIESVNLRIINSLKKAYDCVIGYSDHTLDIDASLYAVAMGAKIIEKHFTLDRKMEGPDHVMSVDPESLKKMCEKIRQLETMLGESEIVMSPAEKDIIIYRRPTEL